MSRKIAGLAFSQFCYHQRCKDAEYEKRRRPLTKELLDGKLTVEECQLQLFKAGLYQCLKKLSFLEQRVLISRYGLYDKPILTLEEIGRQLNVTRARVRQCEARALNKLTVLCRRRLPELPLF